MKLKTKAHIHPVYRPKFSKCAIVLCVVLLSVCCGCENKVKTPDHELVSTPEQMTEKVPDIIKRLMGQVADNVGKLDSVTMLEPDALQYIYNKNRDDAWWSRETKWTPAGEALIKFIGDAQLYGLFPDDYHYRSILSIKEKVATNENAKKDAVLWSKADLLLTDGLLQIIKDVKLGRLEDDSITLRKDSSISKEFYEQKVESIVRSVSVETTIDSLEPAIKDYHELRNGIKEFLDSARFKEYTYVPYPVYDSTAFQQALQRRLFEEGLLDSTWQTADAKQIAKALKGYQKKKKLTVDGKAGSETIGSLNLTDRDKFIRIALTLDKYKMLPARMPDRYIWVNLAGYYMQLRDDDTARISSKVVVGKPLTRTPELTSSISEMITYPQWSVPQSIILKEFLPELKKNPGYLAKKGFSLLDKKNREVDPYFVDWSKFKTSIPYKIVQGSGDDNALGVMKFNFPNKYAVYLHDTNQRYLFGQSSRALSHGCVRVQEWEKLTDYILKNDSSYSRTLGSHSFTKKDSVEKWLNKKEKHSIPVRNKIPLFIRYLTCEGKDGKIIFYDDIYNEDRMLGERYFAKKRIMD